MQPQRLCNLAAALPATYPAHPYTAAATHLAGSYPRIRVLTSEIDEGMEDFHIVPGARWRRSFSRRLLWLCAAAGRQCACGRWQPPDGGCATIMTGLLPAFLPGCD